MAKVLEEKDAYREWFFEIFWNDNKQQPTLGLHIKSTFSFKKLVLKCRADKLQNGTQNQNKTDNKKAKQKEF